MYLIQFTAAIGSFRGRARKTNPRLAGREDSRRTRSHDLRTLGRRQTGRACVCQFLCVCVRSCALTVRCLWYAWGVYEET